MADYDFTGTVVVAGRFDDYYGGYGGAGGGFRAEPTSYNSWQIGYPGGSVAPNIPGARSYSPSVDPYSGRMSPTFDFRVQDQMGAYITHGTASQLLSQVQAVDNATAYANRNYRDHTAHLKLGTGEVVNFATQNQFWTYLQRSSLPLIPDTTLAWALESVLDRPAMATDIATMQSWVNNGGSLSTVRWAVAHGSEAAGRIQDMYATVLDRNVDAGSLATCQDGLGSNVSLDDLRSAAAHSPEGIARLNDQYQRILGRPIDPVGQSTFAGLEGSGWGLSDVRWAIAHTPEAAARLDDQYSQVLGRSVDGQGVTTFQDLLGTGWSQGDVRWAIAHTIEAASKITGTYNQVLGRGAEAEAITGLQNSLGNGTTQQAIRWSVAHSPEAGALLTNPLI